MRAKITKRLIDATQPSAKDLLIWDSELKGFGLKITPGGRRVFVAQYWSPIRKGVRRRVSLGHFGPLTADQGRSAAMQVLAQVAAGHDPAVGKSDPRGNALVSSAAEDFLTEVRAKLKPRTADEYARLFRVNILPELGSAPLSSVEPSSVARLHVALADRPYLANRILQLLRTFFYWAERREFVIYQRNPCQGISKFKETPSERFLSREEVARLGQALDVAQRKGLPPAPQHRKHAKGRRSAKHRPKSADIPIPANPFAIGAIRFLLLSGWREQEALTLRWTEVDFRRGFASLSDTKSGRSHRPLGAPAIQLLRSLPRIHGSPYVFPGADPHSPLREIRRVWYASRHAARLDDVRLHDLRHTVASFAIAEGHSLYVTGQLLGHLRSETTQRYAHLADDSRRAAADSVSGAIASALELGSG
jgi:integrase